MIPTLQRLKTLFFLLTLACLGQVQAQECEHLGVVSSGFLLGEFNCEIVILSDGIDIFQPIELSEEFSAGSIIRFSYEILDSTDCSDDVPLINITCLEPFFESGDSLLTSCNFDINSTIISDTLGTNIYELEVFNQTDFGEYHPKNVNWYEYETGKVLGNEPIITFTPTENSPPVINICADITVEIQDNSLCETTLCHTIVPESIFPEIEECQALFVYQPTDQLGESGEITFYNLSFGDYSQIEWDFGDGQIDTTNELDFTYTYDMPGLYEVCLNIQNPINNCASSFCLPVFTVGGSEICNFNDCVFPGDANKDETVNIFDALNLGLGFNTTGEVRPNAVIDPILQAAFDWDSFLFNLNFKHIDCDGDGIVNDQDFNAIAQNYQQISDNDIFDKNPELPEISLKFPADTLYLSPSPSLSTYIVPATLAIGNTDKPISDFYGLAFSFDYNNESVSAIETDYLFDSFIGDSTLIFKRDKFLKEEQQYAVAITRNDHKDVTGTGDVATVSFILELDIIEGRSEVLELDMGDIKTIDANGGTIPITITGDTSRVVIVFDENTSVNTEEQLLAKQFQVYPNPAKETLIIELAKDLNLATSNVTIFNTLGQKMLTQSLVQNRSTLNISALGTGVYWVKIYTEDGVGIQEIVVE